MRCVVSEFDDWWEYHRDAKDSLNFHDAKYVYESQQDKIDELQAKYDELNNRATGIALAQMTTAKLNYDLQGRIDEAMDYIAESGSVNLTSEIALNHILNL